MYNMHCNNTIKVHSNNNNSIQYLYKILYTIYICNIHNIHIYTIIYTYIIHTSIVCTNIYSIIPVRNLVKNVRYYRQ